MESKNQILQRVAHSKGTVVRNDFGQSHQKALRQFLETKEGFRFAARFAHKGDELK